MYMFSCVAKRGHSSKQNGRMSTPQAPTQKNKSWFYKYLITKASRLRAQILNDPEECLRLLIQDEGCFRYVKDKSGKATASLACSPNVKRKRLEPLFWLCYLSKVVSNLFCQAPQKYCLILEVPPNREV